MLQEKVQTFHMVNSQSDIKLQRLVYQDNKFKDIKNKKNFTVAVRLKPQHNPQYNIKHQIKKVKNQNQQSLTFINTKFANQVQQKEEEKFNKHTNFHSYGQKEKTFIFDKIFDEGYDNKDIFQNLIKEKVNLLEQRINLSIMAYGATNSGKTHTIIGNKQQNCQGLASYVLRYILQKFIPSQYKFQFSYLQIYNQCINDLLDQNPELQIKSLQIMEDQDGNTKVIGLKKIKVQQFEKISELIQRGNSFRKLCSNNINASSSRSHAIMELQITNKLTNLKCKLTILDLAGSQKSNYFGNLSNPNNNSSILMKEGSNINRSLLSLGNCIKNLQQKDNFIPYRDSKLTRLLKQNLNGYSHNIMIACITQNYNQYEQNINSLSYASKAMKIQRKLAQKQQKEGYSCFKCQNCQNYLKNQQIKKILQVSKQKLIQKQQQSEQSKIIKNIPKKYQEPFLGQINKILQRINKQLFNLKQTIQIKLNKNFTLIISEEFQKTRKIIQASIVQQMTSILKNNQNQKINQNGKNNKIVLRQTSQFQGNQQNIINHKDQHLTNMTRRTISSQSKQEKKKIKVSLAKPKDKDKDMNSIIKYTPQSQNYHSSKNRMLTKISKFQDQTHFQSTLVSSSNQDTFYQSSIQSQGKKNPQSIQVNISCFKNLTVNIHTNQNQLLQQRQRILKQCDKNLNLRLPRNKDSKQHKSFKTFNHTKSSNSSMLDSNNFTQRMKRDEDQDVQTWKNIIIKRIQSAKKSQNSFLNSQNQSFIQEKFMQFNI